MAEETRSEDQQPEELTGKAKSIANLKPIQPGEVRNPHGRGKGRLNTATIIRKFLTAKEKITHPITKKVANLSQLEIMILAQVEQARNGNTTAFNALLDRVDGKPTQPLAGDPENPLIPKETQVFILPGGQRMEF